MVVLLVVWVLVSLPLFLAARVVTSGKATLGAAMLGTLLGTMVFFLVYYLGSVGTDLVAGGYVPFLVGLVLGFLAFLGFYKILFLTTWRRAFLIALLAVAITIAMVAIISLIAISLGIAIIG